MVRKGSPEPGLRSERASAARAPGVRQRDGATRPKRDPCWKAGARIDGVFDVLTEPGKAGAYGMATIFCAMGSVSGACRTSRLPFVLRFT